jgi:rare lipoprotein A
VKQSRKVTPKVAPELDPSSGASPERLHIIRIGQEKQRAFNRNLATAAHRSLPFGTRVRVIDVATRKSVIVTITDRGPWVRGRLLDLSLAAARTLGITDRGVVHVHAEVL